MKKNKRCTIKDNIIPSETILVLAVSHLHQNHLRGLSKLEVNWLHPGVPKLEYLGVESGSICPASSSRHSDEC